VLGDCVFMQTHVRNLRCAHDLVDGGCLFALERSIAQQKLRCWFAFKGLLVVCWRSRYLFSCKQVVDTRRISLLLQELCSRVSFWNLARTS